MKLTNRTSVLRKSKRNARNVGLTCKHMTVVNYSLMNKVTQIYQKDLDPIHTTPDGLASRPGGGEGGGVGGETLLVASCY